MDTIPNYVGRDFEEVLMERATSMKWDTKWSVRVASRDGAHYVLTRDWDEHRVNVQIENGVVVAQAIG